MLNDQRLCNYYYTQHAAHLQHAHGFEHGFSFLGRHFLGLRPRHLPQRLHPLSDLLAAGRAHGLQQSLGEGAQDHAAVRAYNKTKVHDKIDDSNK